LAFFWLYVGYYRLEKMLSRTKRMAREVTRGVLLQEALRMMLSTSLAAVVMTGFMSAAIPAQQPAWQTDYRKVLAQAAESQKPIAVFIAHGEAGFARVIAEGKLGSEEAQLLKSSYVCLYVDTETAGGKKLSSAFEMKEGLVISGKAGDKQALRHEGPVTQAKLAKYLTKFADPNSTVVATELGGASAPPAAPAVAQPAPSVGYYYGGGCPGGVCPTGGCASGRCPYVR
jgi:hypothetical protein